MRAKKNGKRKENVNHSDFASVAPSDDEVEQDAVVVETGISSDVVPTFSCSEELDASVLARLLFPPVTTTAAGAACGSCCC